MNDKLRKWLVPVLFAIIGWFTRQLYADFKKLEDQVNGADGVRERVSKLETDAHWLQNGQGRLWKKLTEEKP